MDSIILKAMQGTDLRLTYGYRWMVVGGNGVITVYERKAYEKKTRTLIECELSEYKRAINVLTYAKEE